MGSFDIIDPAGHFVYGGASGSVAPGGLPASATSFATASKQVPNTVLTFLRRETGPDVYNTEVGKTNSTAMTIAGVTYPIGSLLMIRNDAESPDNGRSFLFTRQLQYSPPTAAVSPSGTPGTPGYIPAQPEIPGWNQGAFFTVQSGYASVVTGTPPTGAVAGSQVAQAGQIPPDATANVFQIYGTSDFSYLHLTGTTPPTPDSR